MPRTRSLAWSELKIGILAIIAIVVAAGFIFMVGGQGGFFWQRYHLKTRFPSVNGLKEGAVVRVAGVEVGKVTEVQFSGAEVEVVMELTDTMKPRVTTESRALIGSLSLLGEPVIDITASTRGQPLPDWGFIKPGRSTAQLADVADSATRSLDEATRLIQDVRGGRGTVGRLFTDEQLYREVDAFVGAASDVARNLRQGRGTVGRLIQDPAAYRALQSSLDNFDAMLRRINAGEGSLGQLVNDDAFARSLSSATNNIDLLAAKANRGEGTIGKLMNDDALYARLHSVSDRMDQLVARLNQGDGTAGQLLRDKQLYENMNSTVKEVRALVSDIRKDPKKFLNVKVSIF